MSGKDEGANSGRILTIYLPMGQVHSTLIRQDRTVKDVLEKLCELREDLSIDKYLLKDMSGNEIDISKTLGEIGLTEFSFNAKRGKLLELFCFDNIKHADANRKSIIRPLERA